LCNTLYDRDHYKLALGQLNTARSLVDGISRDMIRMVKYGDSLYRCKCLKRAALGRMCTLLKRQKSSLAYLEQVRKHMSRLPALDPHTRTLLLCGLPNVGKSSFMNKITRADVDVQPYAFTTKSLFVGHCDYRYLRWQVIDTPGILDHPLEERNIIEMQAITALAHLTCAVLFFCDISEQCGYTVEAQCTLFKSIRPLFANKQLIFVVNKVDQQPWETLEESKKKLVEDIIKNDSVTMIEMSNATETNIAKVKNTACDMLLASRVDARVAGNKIKSDLMNRLQVFTPVARDNVERESSIPESVMRRRQQLENKTTPDDEDEIAMLGSKKKKFSRTSNSGYAPTVSEDDGDNQVMEDTEKFKTAREHMWENGGPGVWAPDYREQYDLKEEDWRFDAIPQILNGKNVCDYIDPDIEVKLARLEKEEEQLAKEADAANMEDCESDLDEEEEAAVTAIRERKAIIKKEAHVKNTQNHSVRGRQIRNKPLNKMHEIAVTSSKAIHDKMDALGVDTSKMIERGRKRERAERGRKASRSRNREEKMSDDEEDVDMKEPAGSKTAAKKQKRLDQDLVREEKGSRSHSRPRKPTDVGVKDKEAMRKVEQLSRKEGQIKWSRGHASQEGDNRQTVHLIKWMNTGKKRMGTSYCR